MRNINLRYVEETYAKDKTLQSFSLHYPDTFNFGYDIVDDIAVNDPTRRAMVWCNPGRRGACLHLRGHEDLVG